MVLIEVACHLQLGKMAVPVGCLGSCYEAFAMVADRLSLSHYLSVFHNFQCIGEETKDKNKAGDYQGFVNYFFNVLG